MGKKKFIDKKKAATFRLVYKDSSADDYADGSDRVFTRVDGGDNYVPGFSNDHGDGEGSIFDDADEEEEEEERKDEDRLIMRKYQPQSDAGDTIPENVRRELIEMGFPDDGYNYMRHLRDVGISGLTGSFVPNSSVRLDLLRPDVKAYDASKVCILSSEDKEVDSLFISESTRRTRSLKGFDPDVTALLEMDNNSAFDSADELEDDFISGANEGAEPSAVKKEPSAVKKYEGPQAQVSNITRNTFHEDLPGPDSASEKFEEVDDNDVNIQVNEGDINARPLRLLDEQFELLALREYDDDEIGVLDYDDLSTQGPAHISEFNNIISEFLISSASVQDKYAAPAEFKQKEGQQRFCGNIDKKTALFLTQDMTEKYMLAENDILLESSSSEDEDFTYLSGTDEEKGQRDCESIITTHSNLDNHPGKIMCSIDACKDARQSDQVNNSIILLRGKQQLPVDYLPEKVRLSTHEKKDTKSSSKMGIVLEKKCVTMRRPGESKEERRTWKAAVKEEKRTARAAKKELKLLYKTESQRARHVAAVPGPAGIHLS